MTNSEMVRRLDFHLFDGEGAGGAGEGGSGLGPEADAFLESAGGNREKRTSAQESRVEYGKGAQSTDRVGTDQNGGEDIAAEFAALVGKGGRYHDIYSQRVTGAIQDRFKNNQQVNDLQTKYDAVSEALSPMYQVYGVETGDVEGLAKAITQDEDIYRRGAEREGLDLDQYRATLKLRADAERGRQITEAYETQMRQNEMFARWEQEAAELQQAVPNFDLGMEIQTNEQFAKMLDSGLDVRTAFAAAHMEEMLTGNYQEASRQATQNVVNTINARSARPVENGLSRSPAIQRKADPSSLTGEDIDEIMRRVTMEGESISF